MKGDALNTQDVANAWSKAADNERGTVDFAIFTIGQSGSSILKILARSDIVKGATQASVSLTKGLISEPRNLCAQSVLNLLCTMPKSEPQPKFIFVTSLGVTKASHETLPWILKPLYSWGLAIPHADKLGAERVIHHCAAEEWVESEPGAEIMDNEGVAWLEREGLPSPGELKHWAIVRPALLLNGACKGDEAPKNTKQKCDKEPKEPKEPYKVLDDSGFSMGHTISRRDVAHFLAEGLVKNWETWQGRIVGISY